MPIWTDNKIYAFLKKLVHACPAQNVNKKIGVLEKPVQEKGALASFPLTW